MALVCRGMLVLFSVARWLWFPSTAEKMLVLFASLNGSGVQVPLKMLFLFVVPRWLWNLH